MSQTDTIEEYPDIDGAFAPRLTRALIGNERAQADFIASAKGARMPHAWLLCGPQGVGKASFAYLAARAILSVATPQHIETLSPALENDETRLIESEAHPDLFVLKRQYNEDTGKFRKDILADDTRAIKKSFELRAARIGWRVAIIDSIDDMNNYSVNALLRLIEEPPEKCLFLIVCHHPGRLLATIHSRCRKLTFNALDETELQQIIAGRLDGVDPNEAAVAAFSAAGSAGQALTLAQLGGFDLYRDMIGVLETVPQLDIEKLHGLAGRFGARSEPESFKLFCYLFSGWLHRVIRSVAAGDGFQPIFEGEAELVARLGGALPLESALSLWEKVQHQTHLVDSLNLDKKQAILEWFGILGDMVRSKTV